MMDKKPHIKPYLYGMLAGFGAIALSIIFFFLIYRFDGFGSAISTLTGILMPFIYGAVIAYLLKPVCNSIESFLRRFIPEKMNGLINALSVALTILFGLLLVYALVMMIVPQLITSVTTLYYTAQANITRFMYWANHLEFIENNEQIMELLNSAYAALNTNLDTWIKNTLLPSMQNIVSGAAIGVLNVVTVAKNLIIGIIVAVYMLASRKRFVQQGKLVLHSIVRPRWAQLITEEVKYADRMFGGFINGKIMDSAIIGVLCYIGCLIFKFPSALLVSVIIGVTNIIMNIPIVLICFKYLGKDFFFRSVRCMVLFAIFTDYVLAALPVYQGDRMLATICGGVISGVGDALIYMQNSSTGGLDFITMAIKSRHPHMPFGNLTFAAALAVILANGLVFHDVDSIIYGLIFNFLSSYIINRMMFGFNACMMALIVTSDGPAVCRMIGEKVDRGSTILKGYGGYSQDGRDVVLCACSSKQLYIINRETKRIDPGSFIVMLQANEVEGEGFKRLELGEQS